MDFTGRPMRGYIFVTPEGCDKEEDLEYWIDLCLQFNPHAKASKSKKKKTEILDMFLRLETLPETLVVGKSMEMSFVNNLTQQLWRSVMPRRSEIK